MQHRIHPRIQMPRHPRCANIIHRHLQSQIVLLVNLQLIDRQKHPRWLIEHAARERFKRAIVELRPPRRPDLARAERSACDARAISGIREPRRHRPHQLAVGPGIDMQNEPRGGDVRGKGFDAPSGLRAQVEQVQPHHDPRRRGIRALKRDRPRVLRWRLAPVEVLDGMVAPVLDIHVRRFERQPHARGPVQRGIGPRVQVDLEAVQPDRGRVAADPHSGFEGDVDECQPNEDARDRGVFAPEGDGFRGFVTVILGRSDFGRREGPNCRVGFRNGCTGTLLGMSWERMISVELITQAKYISRWVYGPPAEIFSFISASSATSFWFASWLCASAIFATCNSRVKFWLAIWHASSAPELLSDPAAWVSWGTRTEALACHPVSYVAFKLSLNCNTLLPCAVRVPSSGDAYVRDQSLKH